MSWLRFFVLVCDHEACDEESDAEWTLTATRTTARRAGWHSSPTADFCPKHRKP